MPPTSPLAPVAVPNQRGWFGDYGGRFAPEVLIGVLEELDRESRNVGPTRDFA